MRPRLSTPPSAPHLTSTTTQAHAQPRYTYPNRHHLTFCPACSLVGAGPVSTRLPSPRCRWHLPTPMPTVRTTAASTAATVATAQGGCHHPRHHTCLRRRYDADAARPSRCCRRPPPRLHLSPPPAAPLRRPPRPSAAPHPPPPLSPMLRRSRRLTARSPRICRALPSLCRGLVCVLCVAHDSSSARGVSIYLSRLRPQTFSHLCLFM